MAGTDRAHVERLLGTREDPHIQPHLQLLTAAREIQAAEGRDPTIRETVEEVRAWIAQPLAQGPAAEDDWSTLLGIGYLRSQPILTSPRGLEQLRQRLQDPAGFRDLVRTRLATAGPAFKSELLQETRARAQADPVLARQLSRSIEDLREVGSRVPAEQHAPERQLRSAAMSMGCTVGGTNAPLWVCGVVIAVTIIVIIAK